MACHLTPLRAVPLRSRFHPVTPAQRDEFGDDECVEELADDGWAATFDGSYIAADGRRESTADLT
jgi:hypothetical protein